MRNLHKRRGLCLIGLLLMFLFITGAGVKAASDEKVLDAPAVSAESAGWNAIKVSWKGIKGADGYRMYQKTESGWKKVGDYKSTTRWVKVGNLEFNTQYTFTVRAYVKTDSGNVWGKYSSKGASAVTALSQPELGEAVSAVGGVKVTWTAVSGAEGYRVYRKDTDAGSGWKRIAQLKGQDQSSYLDTKAAVGTGYYYTVRAYRVVDSEYILSSYDKKGVEGVNNGSVLPAPAVSASSARWDAIKVSWQGVEGADGYRVYRKTESGWKKVGDYKSTTRWVNVGSLEFNTKYTFTVRAYLKTDSGNIWGKYSSKGASAVTALNQPELGKASNTGKGLQISWTAVKGAEGYRVYRKEAVSGAEWKRITQLKGQSQDSYVDTKGEIGTRYYYTVRAYRVVDSEYILSAYDKKGIEGIRKETVDADVDPEKPMVALTYDDGPSANTPKILDLLEKYGAKATFFVVGDRLDDSSKYRSYVKRAYELGCQIGNHTYEHETLTSLSESQIKSQISKCDAAVKKAAGITPSIMRPPGGNRNATVDKAVGKPLILWSIDTLDWKTRDASKTVSAVLDHVKDGDVILMHDLYAATAEASETIIPALIKKGYQLVTVEELALNRGGMKAGNRYSSFKPR